MTGVRRVTHRWNLPEGQPPARVGSVIRGASMRRAWRVVAVEPVESPVHPNAWRGILEPMPWGPGDPFDLWYPNAAERADDEARAALALEP